MTGPAPPGERPDGSWEGRFVRVEADGCTWSWIACASCGRRLSDTASIARGLGEDCVEQVGDRADALRNAARAQDRALYREHLATGRRLAAQAAAFARRRWDPDRHRS
jgi:hypothetical protein